jgi:hypothetical protein
VTQCHSEKALSRASVIRTRRSTSLPSSVARTLRDSELRVRAAPSPRLRLRHGDRCFLIVWITIQFINASSRSQPRPARSRPTPATGPGPGTRSYGTGAGTRSYGTSETDAGGDLRVTGHDPARALTRRVNYYGLKIPVFP